MFTNQPLCMVLVLHRIDDLENQVSHSSKSFTVPHRPDDLEK
ncbi:hypothetical protein ACINNAV57_0945 [Acinetobacter baumannii Naval-57]|nr:hypothetical protein ACINNAV57_0945 [Acinetobacter baumannii Naval-57]